MRTPALSGIPQDWPLLGRETELGYLGKAIAGGRPGVVLAGAAGVGKTRLASEAIGRAEGQGAATTWVVATRASASIPFGPFAHLLSESLPATDSGLELLRGIADTLTSRAQGRRLVIGIDDAHLLDHGSAALAHQLASSAGFFVLATTRSGEPTPDSVTALWKEGLAERLEVQALSEAVAGELVSRALGGQVDGPTLARLWEASRGNVLFLRELLLAGQETNALRYAGGVWSWTGAMVMSPRLQEILDARLGNLHTDQVALMEVLAYTEPASVSFLEAMFSSSALEAAERQGVVVVEKDGRRLAGRLAHPLYGESVRARCPVLRARDIQRRFAAAVEATGARRRDDLLRMVTARLEAGETAPPEQLLAGARRAYVLDPVLAERLARAAADAGGGIPAQYSLVVSLFGQGRFSEMESVGAGEQRGPANDSERVMETVKSAWALWISEERPDDAHDLLLQAEHDIQDAALRDKLKQTRGFILLYSGRPAEAIPELSLILDRPGANELTCLLAAVVAVLAFAISGRTEQAVAIAERWIDCAYRRAEKSPLSAGRLLTTQSYALMLAGRLREAEALARKEYRRSLSHHASETTAISTGLLGRIALARGLVETAALWLREGAALFRSPSGFTYFPLCLSGLACAAALKGDHVIAQAALVEADDISTPGMAVCEPDTRLAGAWVAAAAGEMSNARAIALEAAELAEEQEAYAYALPALHDVARLGGAGLVATRLRRLASIVEGPFAPACVAHAEALVAHDGAGLDQASAAFEAMGAQLLAAEAAAEAAAAYRAEGRQASMRASSATARRLLQNCEGARTPALSGLAPDPLTSREREVAMLAAKGLTSAEIAERLVLSRRTVENHLQRGYAKLGVTNRTELQSVLAQADEGHGSLSARHQPDLKYPAGQS